MRYATSEATSMTLLSAGSQATRNIDSDRLAVQAKTFASLVEYSDSEAAYLCTHRALRFRRPY
ncbi:hypothetical protein OH76DRAFT_1411500 [Lentinus brumalis]|uniref:Uncharacterized protein n=1 Tax=Lentinus brumalis TaxID=2498619 RepID=A0A371CPB5_9APHY|nr:hypothetical protein OH76DRAFT_1411500 [Polyporus brumalis]